MSPLAQSRRRYTDIICAVCFSLWQRRKYSHQDDCDTFEPPSADQRSSIASSKAASCGLTRPGCTHHSVRNLPHRPTPPLQTKKLSKTEIKGKDGPGTASRWASACFNFCSFIWQNGHTTVAQRTWSANSIPNPQWQLVLMTFSNKRHISSRRKREHATRRCGAMQKTWAMHKQRCTHPRVWLGGYITCVIGLVICNNHFETDSVALARNLRESVESVLEPFLFLVQYLL